MAATPSILVLGLHRIESEDTELRQQILQSYERFHGLQSVAVREYLARIIPLVLIEVVVWNLDDQFDVGHFRQETEAQPEEAWQVAYSEAVLTADGTAVTAEGEGCFRGFTEGRLAFYLHYYDPQRALAWSYGEVQCPPLSPLPLRLGSIRKYRLPG